MLNTPRPPIHPASFCFHFRSTTNNNSEGAQFVDCNLEMTGYGVPHIPIEIGYNTQMMTGHRYSQRNRDNRAFDVPSFRSFNGNVNKNKSSRKCMSAAPVSGVGGVLHSC